MLLLQLPRIHIGNDIAVASRRGREIQHKGGVQVVQHLHAQIRAGVVALVHDHHRFHVP